MLAIGAGMVVAGAGLLVLAAWWYAHQALRDPAPELAPIPPVGALALTLGGLALFLLAPSRPGRLRRLTGRAAALASTAAALLGLLARLHQPWPGPLGSVGRLVGLDNAHSATVGGALAVLLASAALVALTAHRGWVGHLSDALSSAAATVALLALAGYVFGEAYPDRRVLLMPLPTAGAVLILAIGTMLSRPEHGPTSAFAGRGPGNSMARRLAPTLLLLPFAAALLSAIAARAGLMEPPVAITVGTALTILVLAAVFGYTVRRLNDSAAGERELVNDLRGERDFTATLLQAMSEGVVVLAGADHRVIDVNRRWCELAGRPREELIGQLPPYSWAAPEDDVIRRADGTLLPVLASTAAIPDDGAAPRAYVRTYVDMSDRKRAEDGLAARADELERAAAFKTDLMALVSHQMSQPLSSIASLSELLATDWTGLPEEVREELATKIDRNTRRLTGMMNDLNLLFRLDAGTVTTRPAPVPVAEVVETVTSALPTPATPVRNTVDGELYALIDRGHLWQILQNLLSNALRHGEPPIEIGAREEPDGVVITVRDHGPGIPAELVSGLFDRFARGGGLGLFIVRHLVEANGGAVWYEPGNPRGACVHVRLPPAGERLGEP
jgi:signal transduction histidine kinase